MKIIGTGSALPSKVVTNDMLSEFLDTSDEWIVPRTGIRSRHIITDEKIEDLGAKAAVSALEMSGLKPEEIDYCICSNVVSEYVTPGLGCVIGAKIGLKCPCVDINCACPGFIYALDIAETHYLAGKATNVLIICAEQPSRMCDWSDRSTCVLFGDGAGAVVLGNDEPPGVASLKTKAHTLLGADGNGAEFIKREGGCRKALPIDSKTGVPMKGSPILAELTLQGHDVFAFAVRTLSKVSRDLCALLGTTPEELDRVFAHQANGRIIEAVARRMKLPLEKFWLNLETTANTSAASIPISLDQAVRAGELKEGMKIVMVGFGAGLTYAGTYCTWPNL